MTTVADIRVGLRTRRSPDEVYASIDDNRIGENISEYAGYRVDEVDQLYRDLREDNVVLNNGAVLEYTDGNVDEWDYWTNTGERDTMWYVFRVLGEDRFFKAEGYFTSSEGRNWETLHEVDGRQRIVTDWVRI